MRWHGLGRTSAPVERCCRPVFCHRPAGRGWPDWPARHAGVRTGHAGSGQRAGLRLPGEQRRRQARASGSDRGVRPGRRAAGGAARRHVHQRRTNSRGVGSLRAVARTVDASSLAIFGTGAQAEAHARLITRVRSIRLIWIAGRDLEKAQLLAHRLDAELEPDVRAAQSFEAAVARRSDRVRDHLRKRGGRPSELARAGNARHLSRIQPQRRELDDATIMDSLLCVESREAALSAVPPNRDLSEPFNRGIITLEDPPVELGELVNGTYRGCTSPD